MLVMISIIIVVKSIIIVLNSDNCHNSNNTIIIVIMLHQPKIIQDILDGIMDLGMTSWDAPESRPHRGPRRLQGEVASGCDLERSLGITFQVGFHYFHDN